MKVGLKLIKEQAPRTLQECNETKKIPYQSVVGNLMYCMVCTCPNITFVIGMVSYILKQQCLSVCLSVTRRSTAKTFSMF
jgi:hypothetical protein